jgi:hypothetical protein
MSTLEDQIAADTTAHGRMVADISDTDLAHWVRECERAHGSGAARDAREKRGIAWGILYRALRELQQRRSLLAPLAQSIGIVRENQRLNTIANAAIADLTATEKERDHYKARCEGLDELVRGAILLLNGDCPLSEVNCDHWLRLARAALKDSPSLRTEDRSHE